MDAFAGRPDLLLIFVAQIAFIIVQILIYVRVAREAKQFSHHSETKTMVKKNTSTKRKLSRRQK